MMVKITDAVCKLNILYVSKATGTRRWILSVQGKPHILCVWLGAFFVIRP